MIIDSHIHIGKEELLSPDIVAFFKQKKAWEDIREKISPEGVISALDRSGIDKGVIFPLTFMPTNGNWQAMNDMTAEYVALYPQRFIGFAIVNPRQVAESVKELERCRLKLGFKGVKLHPSMQEFFSNSESMFPVYQYCQEHHLPILFHTGASLPSHSDKFSHPILLDDVAAKFPDLKIVIAHMGRPYYQDAALLMRKHANIYADVCANQGRVGGTTMLEMALTWLKIYADGVKRLLFASDYPVFDPKKGLDDLEFIRNNRFLPNSSDPIINDEEYQAITALNCTKILLDI